MRQTITLCEPVQAHQVLRNLWPLIKSALMAGHRLVVEVRPEKRSDAQNRRMWAMLADISEQVDWYGHKLTAEEWKHVFSAAMHQQKVVPALESGKFVVLGQHTSRMSKSEMSDLQELMTAFGNERGVAWSDPQWEEGA